MKKLELQINDENLILTMDSNIANRNEDIKYFIELLNKIEGAMTIAINGDWGSGKTFLVKQIIMIMTYLNENLTFDNPSINEEIKKIFEKHSSTFKAIKLNTNFVPIYYNAWQNDNHNDPILSLIYTIINKMGSDGKEKITPSNIEKINSILNMINMPFINNIGSAAESFQKKDCTQPIIDSEEITSILNSIIEEKVKEDNKKIVMFIDELDRCNPKYAVKTLERVKHFFDNENMIFVFSTNMEQLSKTVTNYYGNGFASSRYLLKFFDYIVEMPKIDIESFLYSFNIIQNSDYYFDLIVRSIAKQLQFSMRDCARYLQSVESLRNEAIGYKGGGFSDYRGSYFLLIIIAPMLLGLRINDIDKYNEFVNGVGLEIFKEIVNNNDTIKSALDNLLYDERISYGEKTVVVENLYYSLFTKINEKGFSNAKISISASQIDRFFKKISNLR